MMMTRFLALILCVFLAGEHATVIAEESDKIPTPPAFSQSYEVKYNFSLPYMERIQQGGLQYNVQVWRDEENHRVRIDSYGGINSEITAGDVQYQVSPRISSLVCSVMRAGDEEYKDALGAKVLPDISRWEFTGKSVVHGHQALEWTYEHWTNRKHIIYKFYSTADGTPLQWHMHGQDGISGAHYDEWVVDYYDYASGIPNSEVFNKPSVCEGVEEKTATKPNGFSWRMASLCPVFRFSRDEEYDAFSLQHGRDHVSPMEYEVRKAVYYNNKLMIDSWNQGNQSFTMAINRFADWTQEEFETVMLPNRARKAQRANRMQNRKNAVEFQSQMDRAQLPSAVDWRGTGAEGPVAVKDQATCGSCWAFGAVGAITAAYYMDTGNSVDFSQQQLVDCSWDYDNNGCDGGDYDMAFEYLVENGGIATNSDYKYLGQDGFCKANTTQSAAKIKSYVILPEGDEDALKEALYLRGPVAIALDAGHPSFRFYSSGVYYEPKCLWKMYDLDHAVMAVGYGTSDDGEDYWIVRNSWSSYWGDGGYIKMSRKGHACGITTQSSYVTLTTHQHTTDIRTNSVAQA